MQGVVRRVRGSKVERESASEISESGERKLSAKKCSEKGQTQVRK